MSRKPKHLAKDIADYLTALSLWDPEHDISIHEIESFFGYPIQRDPQMQEQIQHLVDPRLIRSIAFGKEYICIRFTIELEQIISNMGRT